MPKRKVEDVKTRSSHYQNKRAKLEHDETQLDGDAPAAIGAMDTTETHIKPEAGMENSLDEASLEQSPEGPAPNSPCDRASSCAKDSATAIEQEETQPKARAKRATKKSTAAPKKKAAPKSRGTKPKAAKPAGPRKSRSKKPELPPEPVLPKPSPINQIVRIKVQNILHFVDTTSPSDTVLARDPANPNLVTLTKSHLTAALMTMRQDYEVGDPMWASIATDVPDAVVREFSAPTGSSRTETEWIVVDVGVKTELEKLVERKVAGWGLEDIGVLEVELELVGRRVERLVEESQAAMECESGGEKRHLGVCLEPAREVV